MGIFHNTWFIGIATGIISGLAVFFITKYIMDKKENTAHIRQIEIANQELIATLKPYIADKGLPDIEIFNSLIASIARKYKMQAYEMYSVNMYCEELIREIISDIYVSNDKKEEYTRSLSDYIHKIVEKKKDIEEKELFLHSIEMKQYRSKVNRNTSVLLSLTAALFSLIISLILSYSSLKSDNSFWYPFDENPTIWVPIIIVVITIGVTMLIAITNMYINMKEKIKKDKK
jgi:hypothetical protein